MAQPGDDAAALSLSTKAVLTIIVASAGWIVLRLVLSIVRGAASVGRRLLGSSREPAAAAKGAAARRGADVATPAKAKHSQEQQQPQTPGVSLKQLMKSAAKAKGGMQAGPDRHGGSELFLTGLRGHADAVTGLAFSADGWSLATACEDRTVRLYDISNLGAKSIPFKRKELLKVGCTDVAFASESSQKVAVQTRGLANYAGLAMLDFSPKEPEVAWEREDIHKPSASGLCLAGASSSKGGLGVLVSASAKTDLRIFDGAGRELGGVDTGGLNNYMATVSRDGRWVAAATFTADVKVHEVVFDRTGSFSGIGKVAMALKGHRSRVMSLDFSPDLGKMATASADSTLKIWNINVRYHMAEDPKVLLTVGLALPPGQVYSRLAWGPYGFIAGAHGSLIHILDARTGDVVERIEAAHDGEITCLEWGPVKLSGPQGKVGVLASGGRDGRVRLWRAPYVLV